VIYLLLRFVKLLAVAMLFSGTAGALVARDIEDQRRFAWWLAGPGFMLTWLAGFGLAAHLSVSITATFIVLALPLSLFSLQVVLFVVGKPGRRSPLTATLALLPLVTTVALMVWRRWFT
jgi:hypothetical protein